MIYLLFEPCAAISFLATRHLRMKILQFSLICVKDLFRDNSQRKNENCLLLECKAVAHQRGEATDRYVPAVESSHAH